MNLVSTADRTRDTKTEAVDPLTTVLTSGDSRKILCVLRHCTSQPAFHTGILGDRPRDILISRPFSRNRTHRNTHRPEPCDLPPRARIGGAQPEWLGALNIAGGFADGGFPCCQRHLLVPAAFIFCFPLTSFVLLCFRSLVAVNLSQSFFSTQLINCFIRYPNIMSVTKALLLSASLIASALLYWAASRG